MKSNPTQVIQKIEHLVSENEKINKELKSLKKNSNGFKNQNFKREILKKFHLSMKFSMI